MIPLGFSLCLKCLYINNYNLERYQVGTQNLKCEGLISYVERWESDNVTRIDGIGTQMHTLYSLNPATQATGEAAYVNMLKLLAATGKLIKISELDMGVRDASGNTLYHGDALITPEVEKAMAEYYTFIVNKYYEIIPQDQQYGITHWKPIDPDFNSGWKEGEPVGLWDRDLYRKITYAGFADAIINNNK